MQDNHIKFPDKYFETMNAAQSAIFAGFSADTAKQSGYQILQREDVQEYLQKMRQEYAEKAGVSKEWVIERFKHISDACVQATPVMEFDPIDKCMKQKFNNEDQPVYEFDSSGAVSSTREIGKIIGAYEKDNEQKQPKTIDVTLKPVTQMQKYEYQTANKNLQATLNT